MSINKNSLEYQNQQLQEVFAQPLLNLIKEHNCSLESYRIHYDEGLKILEIIINHPDGVDIDLATKVNEAVSLLLDQYDFIEDEYYLEVSSPIAERVLVTIDDYKKSIGKYLYIITNDKIIVGKKPQNEFYGDLIAVDEDKIIIKVIVKQFRKEVVIPINQIRSARLAIKF